MYRAKLIDRAEYATGYYVKLHNANGEEQHYLIVEFHDEANPKAPYRHEWWLIDKATLMQVAYV